MLKSVPVEESVGMVLPHDITEIVKDVKKGAAFKKGHIIRPEDVAHLKRLGKDNIYVISLTADEVHENEAAAILARCLAGRGVEYVDNPQEGKIALTAALDGLLRINRQTLYQFNMLGEVMCSTLHDNTPVKKGETVAATRLIPLVSSRKLMEQAEQIALSSTRIVEVLPLKKVKIGLVITGNEVFYGRIEDRFEEVLQAKAKALGSEILLVRKAPDDKMVIAREIGDCIAQGAELIVTSGGMSVDPDDVTREGILQAGATEVAYGTPVLPGAMFLSGMIGKIPVLGLPACGMYHKITVFDLVLPRILTGQKIGRKEFAELGHGGLCRNCKVCQYPICNFGK
ncbi:molybdopterin-binding protein [Desulfopila sp. IMCC35006]|uniref:molybdopterin-binding protein n=1 Tax=Desulfopila sp. IMCC35006 TaxID=2569542 RepID=UPI0010AD2C76|nr:molybdopterin-binding protein [Desulfopila sp. IMCC35006]TKB27384.1 molybdopterin-binding protein [Desulfopila sp. IMCC35006]